MCLDCFRCIFYCLLAGLAMRYCLLMMGCLLMKLVVENWFIDLLVVVLCLDIVMICCMFDLVVVIVYFFSFYLVWMHAFIMF